MNSQSNDLPLLKVVALAEPGRIAVAHLIQNRLGNVEYILVGSNPSQQPVVRHFSSSGQRLNLNSDTKPFSEKMRDALQGAHMIFIVGEGPGSTETQAIAQITKHMGVLTVAVFPWPSITRTSTLQLVRDCPVDTTFLVKMNYQSDFFDHQKVSRDAREALTSPIKLIAELCKDHTDLEGSIPMSIDLEDLHSILTGHRLGIFGFGKAAGADRARLAAESASSFDGHDLSNAKGVAILIAASRHSLKLAEMRTIMKVIYASFADDGLVTLLRVYDESLKDQISVSVLATFKQRHQNSFQDFHAAL